MSEVQLIMRKYQGSHQDSCSWYNIILNLNENPEQCCRVFAGKKNCQDLEICEAKNTEKEKLLLHGDVDHLIIMI